MQDVDYSVYLAVYEAVGSVYPEAATVWIAAVATASSRVQLHLFLACQQPPLPCLASPLR